MTTTTTTIQPLPFLRTFRFGRAKEIHEQQQHTSTKTNQVNRPAVIHSDEIDANTSILITDIRKRDWNFADDFETLTKTSETNVKYRLISSMNNTMKMKISTHQMNIDENTRLYDEYDMDEQDFQWLSAFNQYRFEKNLPELDENIFEYVMQLLEHQCFTVYRQKNYEDNIRCDICRRLDDVDDLIQCIQCNTIVHRNCYDVANDDATNHDTWKCLRCLQENSSIRCYLCYQSQGAMKPMKILIDGEEEVWVHLSCAFWCPSITFTLHNNLILSTKLSNDGSCSICYQSLGVKILCSWKHCSCQFHARCAMNHGHDMLVVESDDKNSVRLLALCYRHTEKIDSSENESRKKRTKEQQQHRFEQFASDINLDFIKNDTQLLPDIIESVYTYWLLKRKANDSRPLIDVPNGSFDSVDDQRVNLLEFARRHHQDQPNLHSSQTTMMLPLVGTPSEMTVASSKNLFVQFAHRQRNGMMDYDRNLFCILDGDKKARLCFTNTPFVVKNCF